MNFCRDAFTGWLNWFKKILKKTQPVPVKVIPYGITSGSSRVDLKGGYNKFHILIFGFLLLSGFVKESYAQLSYNNSLALSGGIYSSAGFDANPFGAVRYDHYLKSGRHFFEVSFGISSIHSDVLSSIAGAQLFENERLLTYELVYGYNPNMWRSFPYLTMGVADISQGGQSKFAFVLGIGNRIKSTSIFGMKNLSLRYDLRDQILRQRFNNRPSFLAHNLVFSLIVDMLY